MHAFTSSLAPDAILTAGQIAIIQYSTDDSDDPHVDGNQNMARDSLSFILLDGVTAGTQIHFTDRTWIASGAELNGGAFSISGADGTYTWTASTDLAAGTVITINEAELTAAGMELIDTGEAVYIYQGAVNTPVRFLGAIEMADGNDIFTASLVNTGLTVGINALAIAEDNGSFGERTWNHQLSTLFQNIVNQTNWHTNENSPQANQDEGTNLFVAPDHQLWMAGINGGHGLMTVTHDSTQNGGASYNQQHYFQNTSSDGDGLTQTQRFWSPTHILFDTVGNKFFVVDSSGTHDRILQGNISDLLTNPGVAPTMTILWSDKPAEFDGDGITGMQLDIANGHVYFTADNKLLRVGFNTADQTAVTLVDFRDDSDSFNKNFANEFVLDLANNRAFVIQTESSTDFIEVPPGSGNFVLGTTTYQNSIHLVSNLSSADTGVGDNTHTQLDFTEAFDDDDSAFGTDQLNEFDNLKGRITDIELNKSTGEIWFTTVQLNDGTDGSVGGIYKATLSGNTLNVVQIYTEGNGTNQNFFHIHVDEETGHYYVSSQEPGEGGQHAIYRGNLSDAAGTAPTLYARVGSINEMTPRDMTLESAPTLTGTDAAGGVTEASSAPASGDTAKVSLFSGVTASDIDTSGGDELAGAIVRISGNFLRETSTTAGHSLSQDFLTINNLTSGTIAGSGITFTYDSTTGVMTLSGPGTVAEYKAALELVQFHTSGDNPTNDGTNTVRTISASVFDGLLYSDEISATVSVTGINDSPVNTMGLNDSGNEDGGIAVTGLAVADADASPSEEDITVTLTVTNGALTIGSIVGGVMLADVSGNGTATVTITATQNEINTTFAGTNGVTFNPAAQYNGVATLTMTTNDLGQNGNDPGNGGTGTTEQDVDAKSIQIVDVNDAPTVAGDGTVSAAAILEDGPSSDGQTVDTLFGGQFSDALDQQFVSGTNPAGSLGDSFAGIAITANGSAPGTGQWQYFNGTAWVDIGAASADAAITLNSATAIRFNPALNFDGAAPTLTARLIESGGAAITDGGTVDLNPAPPTFGPGSVYSAGSVVLSQTVTAVNDAPVNAVPLATQTFNEDGTLTFNAANSNLISVSDVDGGAGNLSVTLSIQTGGLTLSTVTGVTFTAGDGSGDSTMTFSGTAAAINAALDGLVYAPGANYNGDRTLTITTNDLGATGADPGTSGDGTSEQDSDTIAIDVTAINDAPVVIGDGTKDAAPIAVNTPTDGESVASLFGGQYSDSTDAQFSVANPGGSSSGAFSGIAIVDNGSSSATGQWQYFNSDSSTWVDIGSRTTASALLIGVGTNIRFNPALDFVGPAPTLTVHLIDNSLGFGITFGQTVDLSAPGATGGTTAYSTGTVVLSQDVVAGNVAPVVDLDADDSNSVGTGFAASYTEGGAAAAISDTDVLITDSDAGDDIISATITITNPEAGDVLTVVGALPPTITVDPASTNSMVVLLAAPGTSAADFQAAIEQITFSNTGDDPTDFGTNTARSITVTVHDGSATSAPATTTMTVVGQNDSPIVTTADTTVSGTEDTDLVFSNGNGNAITVGDRDDASLRVSLTVNNGILTLSGTTGLSITGDGTGTVELIGSAADINAALEGLVYRGTLNFEGGDTLSIVADDGTDTDTESIVITLVDDGTIDGDADDNLLSGTPLGDIFDLSQGGEDQADGLGGNDGFYMGGGLSAGDDLDGGDGTNDQLILQGNVAATVLAGHLQNVEVISILSGDVTRFGDPGTNFYDYSLTMTDGAVDAGERLTIWFAGHRVGEDVFFDGSAETDGHFTLFGGFGAEHLIGGHGSDFFYFGDGRFSVTDRVVGNGGAQDQLGLRGDFDNSQLVFDDDTMTGIDTIALISGSDTNYGPPAAGFGYNIKTHDLNVAAGETLAVWGLNLTSSEVIIFDGSGETNGKFRMFGGAADDVLTGGAGDDMIYGALGADTLRGGSGNDSFVYRSTSESMNAGRDGIQDFSSGDRIDLSMIDANTGTAGDQAFSFIGSGAFTGSAGQLRFENAGGQIWLVQGDTDGNGIADLEIILVIPDADPITATDFIL